MLPSGTARQCTKGTRVPVGVSLSSIESVVPSQSGLFSCAMHVITMPPLDLPQKHSRIVGTSPALAIAEYSALRRVKTFWQPNRNLLRFT